MNPSLSTPTLLVLFATPFLWNRQWGTAAAVIFAIMFWQGCKMANQIDERDKWMIRFGIMSVEDIVQTLANVETQQQQEPRDDNERLGTNRNIVSTGLSALAKKYDEQKRKWDEKTSGSKANPQIDQLALHCQEASYIGFRYFLDSDANMVLCEASIALLALIAKNEAVRERHRYEADVYGLDTPVKIIRQALDMAKDIQDDHQKEQEAAEILRKSCLFLGALAEGNPDLAQLIAGEGGIDVIANAARWYRYHSHVGNWALWALFMLCYEYPPNKHVFVESGGVSLVIQILRNCPESIEVARHGVALIFDMMRENPDVKLDKWRIRQDALSSGLHPVIVNVMEKNSTAMDIMMMGSEILVGTGYKGEVPAFKPTKVFNGNLD